MRHSRSLTVRTLLTWLVLALSQVAYAQRSYVEDNNLVVPRIDVEGYGALELTFRIGYDGQYLFWLLRADQTSEAIANSGVFNPQDLTIAIDEIELPTGELYSATLQLLSQDPFITFVVIEAEQLNPGQVDPGTDTSAGAEAYASQCASCHGVDGSGGSLPIPVNSGLSRVDLVDIIETTMPLGNPDNCDAQCAADIADYILLELSDGSGGGSSGGESLFSCTAPSNDPGPTALARLTPLQYKNTVRELFGPGVNLDQALPGGLSDQEVGKALADASQFDVEGYRAAAAELAEYVEARVDDYAPCADSGSGAAARQCATQFLESLGTKIYRSPLAASDVDALLTLFDVGYDSGGYARGMALLIEAMMQAPRFIYRPEIGNSLLADETAVPLTDYELASRLSFMFWNQGPDDELLALAEEGRLNLDSVLAEQVLRLSNDPRAQESFLDFFDIWFGLTGLEWVEKDPNVFPAWDDIVSGAMREQADGFFSDILFGPNGSLNALFTTPLDGYAPTALDDWYADASTPRDGLLTLPALLSVHSKPEESFPIYRGLFVREQLFCHQLPPPPDDIGDPPPPTAGMTNRDRYAQHTLDPGCQSCHAQIDPLGFAFENFDATGRFHEFEFLGGVTVTLEAEDCEFSNAHDPTPSDDASGGIYIDFEAGGKLSCEYDGAAGPHDISFTFKRPGGVTRSMGVFVNDSKVGVLSASSNEFVTVTFSNVELEAENNLIEIRDTEGTRQLDIDKLEIGVGSDFPAPLVDASGELTGTDVDGSFTGLADLSVMLGESETVRACATRQWFRHVMQRYEVPEDDCSLKDINDAFRQSGDKFESLRSAIVNTPAFRFRRVFSSDEEAP